MPSDPAAAVEGIARSAEVLWWLLTNPWIWLLVAFSCWEARNLDRTLYEKDLEEWRKRNCPKK